MRYAIYFWMCGQWNPVSFRYDSLDDARKALALDVDAEWGPLVGCQIIKYLDCYVAQKTPGEHLAKADVIYDA